MVSDLYREVERLKQRPVTVKPMGRASTPQNKTEKINDIDFNKWSEYKEILTDSLWRKEKDDNSSEFGSRIPHQLMLRYTKKGDWVLDMFVGDGNTLIECKRLGRNGIGIGLNKSVVEKARNNVAKESNPNNVRAEVVARDSQSKTLGETLSSFGVQNVQLLIMHPPQVKREVDFYEVFDEAVNNAAPFLEKGRYFGLVTSDRYEGDVLKPLSYECMNRVLARNEKDFVLKSIIVKESDEANDKKSQSKSETHKALADGVYVTNHEYVLLFQKRIKPLPDGNNQPRRQKRKARAPN